MTQDEPERADLRTTEQRDFDNLLRDYHAAVAERDSLRSSLARVVEALKEVIECHDEWTRDMRQSFKGFAFDDPLSDAVNKVRSALHRSQGE